MRSKLANRSRSEAIRAKVRSRSASDQLGARAHEPDVDRHRALGRLAEVEALPEVDPEVEHRLELVDALDALGHDLAAELVRAVDERVDEPPPGGRVLDPGGQRVVDLG